MDDTHYSRRQPFHYLVVPLIALVVAFTLQQLTPIHAMSIFALVIVFLIALISTPAALYLLVFSMLLSPEIVIGKLGGGAALGRGITIRLDDFLLLFIGFGWLTRTVIYKELGLFLKTPLNRPIFCYMLVCLISTMAGILMGRVNPPTGFFFVLKFFEFFFVYFMVVNNMTNEDQIKRFVIFALVICCVVSLYAIAQIPGGGRVTAPFEGEVGEPNTLGGYLVFMLSIAGAFFISLRSQRARIPLAGLTGLIVVALMATQSRASYIAALVVFGAFLYLALMLRRDIWLFAVLGICLLISPFLLPSTVEQRIKFTYTQPRQTGQIHVLGVRLDTSTSARIIAWQRALRDFKEHPLIGYGVTGYPFIDAQFPRVLVETGLLGLLAFLYLMVRIWRQGISIYKTAADPYERGLASGFLIGFLGLLVHSIGANTFIIVRIMEPFWLFAGLLMALHFVRRQEEQAPLTGSSGERT